MTVKFSNNGKTTVSSAVSATDTTVSVTDASVFPTTGASDFYMTLEKSGVVEIVKVMPSVATIYRHACAEGTTATTFAVGDKQRTA